LRALPLWAIGAGQHGQSLAVSQSTVAVYLRSSVFLCIVVGDFLGPFLRRSRDKKK
jgi:hypothetical protein